MLFGYYFQPVVQRASDINWCVNNETYSVDSRYRGKRSRRLYGRAVNYCNGSPIEITVNVKGTIDPEQ